MSDVFISYARAAAARAHQVAEALRALGYDVWRDDQIPAHRAYTEVIDERLQAAKAVVVVWSTESVKSEWVQSEAETARTERKLIQLNIDDSRLPRPFDRIQCTDISGWDGGIDAPVWRKVVESVAHLTGVAPVLQRPMAGVRVGAMVSAEPSGSIEGERKSVTVLAADFKDWLERQDELDPEDALAITEPAARLIGEVLQRCGGHVARVTEDGLLAVFGAPVAREDHAQQALFAALAVREDLARQPQDPRLGVEPLEVRVGISTGEVVVRATRGADGRERHVPSGPVVSLASRLHTSAKPGAIVASPATAKLAEGYFEFRPLEAGAFEVIGVGVQRTRLQGSARRGYTSFVGRERELEVMVAAAARAQAGRGQVVAAMAEPGVGKSRLMVEFKCVDTGAWTVLEAFGSSHGKSSAYLPVVALLHGYFDIAPADDAAARRRKIADRISALDPALDAVIPFVNGLLGVPDAPDPLADMPAQDRRRRTHEAVKRLLLRESLERPLLVIVEDLHWIDEATQEVLTLLSDSIGAARVLLLVNYRPEYADPWRGRTYHTQLRLDGLADSSAHEMMASLLGAAEDLAPLKALIIERTEGNPFFMEETVLTLFDEGILVRDEGVRLTRPLAGLKIPPTVQAILAARIDRLPGEQKALLQTLAVIGRSFTLGLVTAVTGAGEMDLAPLLSALQQGEFIYELPSLADLEYTFKHALTHDVAYASLLNERRRALHLRTAGALEAAHAATAVQADTERGHAYTLLAHHLEEAGEWSRAASYLQLESARVFAFGLVEQAVEIGLHAARLAGAELPAEPEEIQSAIGAELGRIATLLGDRQPRDLASLPLLDDPRVGQQILLLLVSAPFAHQGERLDVFTLLVCTALRLTLEHGQGPLAPDVFAMYSIVFAAVTGDQEQGAAWSRLGLDLQGKARGGGFCRCAFMHTWFHNHWVAPLSAGVSLAEEGADAGLADGELLYGCFNLSAAVVFEAAAGQPLQQVMESARVKVERNGRRVLNAFYHLIHELQFAKALAGQTAGMLSLGDTEVDEAEIDAIVDSGLSNQIGYYLVSKAKLAVFDGDWKDALAWASKADPVMPYCGGQTAEFELAQYRGLAALALAVDGGGADKPALIEEGRARIGQLRAWSQLNPGLFAHKADLLEGVLQAAEGQITDAQRRLESAASAAESGGFLHDAGLAREHLARVRRAAADTAGAASAAIAARETYALWGAAAKAAHVAREFSLPE